MAAIQKMKIRGRFLIIHSWETNHLMKAQGIYENELVDARKRHREPLSFPFPEAADPRDPGANKFQPNHTVQQRAISIWNKEQHSPTANNFLQYLV